MAAALQSIVGGGMGNNLGVLCAAPFFTNFTLNQTTDALEFVLQTEDNVTITKLGIRVGTITGTTPTYRVSIQGLDASGNPDGTVKGGASPASATFSPSGLGWSNNTWHWVTLSNSYASGAGEFIAIVIDYSSGTVDGSNNASFSQHISPGISYGLPYSIQNDAGSRTRSASSIAVAYASSTTAYGFPILTTVATVFNSGTGTADEYGIKFSLPAAWGDTYQILGVRFEANPVAAGSTVIGLYGGTDATAANSTGATTETTSFQTVTLDHDHFQAAGARYAIAYFDESTLTTLYYGATYRISIQPQNTNNITIYGITVDAASDLDAYPLGQNCSGTRRLDAGNWTDLGTTRYGIELILADITEPAAGGGSGPLVGPGRLIRN